MCLKLVCRHERKRSRESACVEHLCRRSSMQAAVDMHIDICIDIHIYMCMDMFVDMYRHVHRHVCTNTTVVLYIDLCVRCVDM